MFERRLTTQYVHHSWRGGEDGHIELTSEVIAGLRPMHGRKVDLALSNGVLVDMLAFANECDKTGETARMIADKLGGTPPHEFESGDEGTAWRPLCKVCGHESNHGIHT